MIDRTLLRLLEQPLTQFGKRIKATRLTLLCRVGRSVTTGRQWVTNLTDYLKSKGSGDRCAAGLSPQASAAPGTSDRSTGTSTLAICPCRVIISGP